MRFLLRLLSRCLKWLRPLPRQERDRVNEIDSISVPYELTADEFVARFIYSDRHFSVSSRRPNQRAFNPSPHTTLSVAHSTGLADLEIWELGRRTMGTVPGRRTIHARADIPVQSLIERRLRSVRDDNPFQRHTNVVDWPRGSDPDQTKQMLKEICLQLSQDQRIVLRLPPNPIVRT
jgi:hypothetical protein